MSSVPTPPWIMTAMHQASDHRAPAAVRVVALVGAAVVLGAAAHLSASGSLGLGALMATTLLLVVLVSGVVAAGMWLAARLSRWSSLAQDAAAGAGLVMGQLLVHWLGSGPTRGIPTGPVHPGHAPPTAVDAGHVIAHGADAGGPAMLAAHCVAAVAAGALLRWLEASLTSLGAALVAAGRCLRLAVARPVRLEVAAVPRRAADGRGRQPGPGDVPALELLRSAVVRRGPPASALA